MKRTFAAIAAVLLASCTDTAMAPVVKEPDPVAQPTEVLTGIDALRRQLVGLRRQLEDPEALARNAQFTGQTIEERRAELLEAVAAIEGLLAPVSFGAGLEVTDECSSVAKFTSTIQEIEIENEPIFPGLPRLAKVWGYSWSDKPSRHRIYHFVQVGGQWTGFVDYSNPTEEADETSTGCVTYFAVATPTFAVPEDSNGCWYIYAETMFRLYGTKYKSERYLTSLLRGGPCARF